jgi:LmbE family N-acetylglucosaminyl deacetylase
VARRTGAQLWEYPIWFWHWAQPDDAPWTQWRTFTGGDEEWRAKRAAIAAHESQVAPLSDAPGDETLLRPDILEYFETGPEHFVVTAAADLTDEPWPAPDGSAGA